MSPEAMAEENQNTIKQLIESFRSYDEKLKCLLENQKSIEEVVENNSNNVDTLSRNQDILINELEAALTDLQNTKDELKKTKYDLKKTKDTLFEMTELIANDSLKRESESKTVVVWNLDHNALGDSTRQKTTDSKALKSFAMDTLIKKFLPEVYEPGLVVKRLPNSNRGLNRLRLIVTFTTVHEKQMFLSRCFESGFRTVQGGKTSLQRKVVSKHTIIAESLNKTQKSRESEFASTSNGMVTERNKRAPKERNLYKNPSNETLLNDHRSSTKILDRPLSYLKSTLDEPPPLSNEDLKRLNRISTDEVLLFWYWSPEAEPEDLKPPQNKRRKINGKQSC